MQVEDRVWVITGAGSGIGRALVEAVLARGGRVAAVDLRPEGLGEVAQAMDAGDRLSTHVLDITDRDGVAALPDAVVASHGAVDGLINNAGIIQPFVRLNDLDYGTIERVIDVNLFGTIHMVKAFLPLLLARPEAHVANVSSMGGFLPVPGQTMYGAAKAGVKLMTEGLYAELLETNVGVSCILPGAVATNIVGNSGVEVPDTGGDASQATGAEDAARIILDGIVRDELHILVGRDSQLMYGLSRIAPKRATHFITRQMKKLLG